MNERLAHKDSELPPPTGDFNLFLTLHSLAVGNNALNKTMFIKYAISIILICLIELA
jgi:hypothetical protein